MKKALIIGCPGSGKTTFSKALAEKTGLPLVHLDKLYHRDNWQIINREEFMQELQAELEKPEWIIDGNFNRTIEYRLGYCDTVFYFDLPVLTCLWGAIKRTIQNYGKTRDDIGGNCPEKFDKHKIEFFKFIIGFKKQHQKNYTEMLKNAENVNVVVFRSRKQADEYLKNLKFGKIKKLDIADYHKCNNIWNMKRFPFTEKFRKEIEGGNRVVFVYEVDGEFIGEIGYVFDENDPDYTIPGQRIYFSRLIVKKEYRNQGIGSKLIDYAIDSVKEMGYKEISIGVNKDNETALHLYRKKGFDKVIFDGADEDGEYYKLLKIL